jgi:hypothetical protein
VIDNFVPQPYPLECSPDGSTWHLVLGWRQHDDTIAPVIALPDGGTATNTVDEDRLTYRQARPPAITLRPSPTTAPRAVAPPAVSARRERDSA